MACSHGTGLPPAVQSPWPLPLQWREPRRMSQKNLPNATRPAPTPPEYKRVWWRLQTAGSNSLRLHQHVLQAYTAQLSKYNATGVPWWLLACGVGHYMRGGSGQCVQKPAAGTTHQVIVFGHHDSESAGVIRLRFGHGFSLSAINQVLSAGLIRSAVTEAPEQQHHRQIILMNSG